MKFSLTNFINETTFFIFTILYTYVNYEWILRDTETGKLLTDGPSHYQLPTVADLPKEFNVTLLENSNPGRQSAIYSSKAQCSVAFYPFSEEVRRLSKSHVNKVWGPQNLFAWDLHS